MIKKLLFAISLILSVQTWGQVQHLVISQVYGGGGTAGAAYSRDFIELFNPTAAPVSINGWSVQYTTNLGTVWTQTILPNVSIPSGQYYLVGEFGSGTPALPAVDCSGSINLSPITGKVALCNSTILLNTSCPLGGSVVDFVGYGSSNCFEGSGNAPVLTIDLAAFRAGSGCVDTDDNLADFMAALPNPRNSTISTQLCSYCTPPTAQATAFTAGAITTTGMTVGWTRGNGDSVLVICTAGSAPSVPSSGINYMDNAALGSGSAVGGGFCVYKGTGTSVTVSGLTGGTSYNFAVYEYMANGPCYNLIKLSGQAMTSCIGAPAATAITTASLVTGSSFTANWTASAGATGYFIDVCTDTAFTAFVGAYSNFSAGNVTTLSITGLSSMTTYYYQIRASNACATSPNTVRGVITLPCLAPVISASAFVSSAIATTGMTVGWTRGNGDSVLVICKAGVAPTGLPGNGVSYAANPVYGNGSSQGGGACIYKGTGSSVSITGLTAATNYYFSIYEYNSLNECYGTPALTGYVATACLTASSGPTANAGTFVTANSFSANWNAVPAATSYLLDVSTNSAFSSFVAVYSSLNVGNVINYSVTGLSSGTTYYYRVREINACGTSPNSGVMSISTPCTPPTTSAASFVSSLVTTTSMTVGWTRGNGDSVLVICKAASAPGVPVSGTSYTANSVYSAGSSVGTGYCVYKGTGSSVNITGLTQNTTYYFSVLEYFQANECYSLAPLTGSVISSCTAGPAVPVTSAATNVNPNTFTANWSAGANAATYYLDVCTDSLFTVFVAGFNNRNVGYVISYNVTGLSPQFNYYYRVRAGNSCSISANSIKTAVLTGCTPPAYQASAFTSSALETNSIKIGWTRGNGNSVLVIARAGSAPANPVSGTAYTANSNYTLGSPVGGGYCVYNGTGNSVDVTGLAQGTLYYFEVCEYSSASLCYNLYPLTGSASTVGCLGPVIFSQNFEGNAWTPTAYVIGTTVNGSTTVLTDGATPNVPSGGQAWTAYTSSGDANDLWHRDDYATGWNGSQNVCGDLDPLPACGANGTSYAALFNNYWAPASSWGSIQSPPINLSAYSSATLNFYYSNYFNTSATLTIQFWNGTSWVTAGSPFTPTGTNSWFFRSVTVPAGCFINGAMVKFLATSDYGTYPIGIDEISLSGCSSCTSPALPSTAFTATSVTPTSMTAGWTRGSGDSVMVVCKALSSPGSPASGTVYHANANYGSGSVLGGGYCVYKGIGNSVNVTGLTANTLYNFAVYEYDAAGTCYVASPLNGNATTTCVSASPVPLVSAATSASSTSFIANWSLSTGATSYYLDVCNDNAFTSFVAGYNNLHLGNTSFLQVTGLASSHTYYYRVRSANACGVSANSATQTVSTLCLPPTNVSSSFTSSAITPTAVTLGWTRGNGDSVIVLACAGSYPTPPISGTTYTANAVYGSGSSAGSGYVVYKGTGTSVNLSGLTASSTYYCRIYEYSGAGLCYGTGVLLGSFTTSCTVAPLTPSVPSASVLGTSSLTLTWGISSYATAYFLDVSTDAAFTAFVPGYNNLNVGSVTSKSVLGLSPVSTYYFRVRAFNTCGTSASSTSGSATTTCVSPTNPATLFTSASITASGMTVGWTRGSGDSVLVIAKAVSAPGSPVDGTAYVANAAYGSGSVAGTGYCVYKGVGTSVSVTALLAETTYYFAIYEYNASGKCYLLSPLNGSATTICTVSPPTATIGAASLISTTSFTANWTAATGTTTYYLDVCTDAAFTAFVTGYNNLSVGNVVSKSVTGLTPEVTYYYRVRASNPCGTSASSTASSLTTTCTPPTTQATLLTSSSITTGSMTIGWTRGNGDSVLVVCRAGAVAGNPVNGVNYLASTTYGSGAVAGAGYCVYKGTGTTVSITGLSAATTYDFSIYEFTAAGKCYLITPLTGTVSTICTVAPPVSSTTTATSIAATSFTANWTSSAGATAYFIDVCTDAAFTAFVTGYNNKNVGNVLAAAVTGLAMEVTYYYRVRAYNACGTSASSTATSVKTTCTPPTVQATAFTSSVITQTGMTIGWTRGNGNNVLVVALGGGGLPSSPVSGLTYTGNAAYGTGASMGNGYCVYNGTGTSVSLTGLTANTPYNFAVYEYLTAGNCYDLVALTGAAATVNCANSTVVFTQNFEGNGWLPNSYVIGTTSNGSATTLTDGVPANIPAGGQSWAASTSNASAYDLWHRSDYSIGWQYPYNACGGTYPPPTCGANGTAHSAVFDIYDAASGTWGSIQSPPFSLAGYPSATLNFYYSNFNTSATLNVEFWNGSAWLNVPGSPMSVTATNAWVLKSVSVPASCLINGTLLKFVATSDFQLHPIAIDEITISVCSSCTPPVTQASNFTSSAITASSLTASWVRGNGDSVLVIAKAGSAPGNPTSGTVYHANAAYGSGTAVGGGYCVYKGAGTSVSLTGLAALTTYDLAVYEYAASGDCYLLTSLAGSATTACGAAPPVPSTTSALSISATSFTAEWTYTAGATGYYLDVCTDAAFTAFVSGYNNASVGNISAFSVTGLSPGTTYYYRVRSNNSCGTSANSNTTSASTTTCVPPTVQASAFSISSGTATTLTIGWTRGNGDSVLVIGKALSAPTDPINGTSYLANAGFGTGYCLYKGIGSSVTVTGLTALTNYHFNVYEFTASSRCYLVPALTGTGATGCSVAPLAPVAAPGTSVTGNSFDANWSLAPNATVYFLDVCTDAAFTSFVAGYNNLNVGNVSTASVSGLSFGVTYYYRVKAGNTCGTSGNSNGISVVTTYCSNTNSSGSTVYYINNFSTTGGTTNITNNASGFSASGYGNFTSDIVTQVTGSTINFSITGGGSSAYGYGIWIDWNQNGSFADAGEQVYASTGNASTVTGSILVPIGALAGSTRMRVVADFDSLAPPVCGGNSSSECEDYTFQISGNCVAPTITGTVPGAHCGPGSVVLGATASSGTIHWYTTSTGGVALGSGNSFTTPSLGATAFFYVDANNGTCTTPSRTQVKATINPAITDSFTTVKPPCGAANGSITATVLTGTAPYHYQWTTGALSNTADSLSSGLYQLTVSDANGCVYNSSITLLSSNGPVVSLSSSTNVKCSGGNNGSITVSASGGAAPYTYSWTTGSAASSISNLSAGTYILTTSDATGCRVVSNYTITQPGALVLQFSNTPSACLGSTGSAMVNVSGGTPAYLYTWGTNAGSQTTQTATNLAPGIYTVVVNDGAGCQQSASTIVSSRGAGATISLDSIVPGKCGSTGGGAIIITTSGGVGHYSYSWSNGATTQNLQGVAPGNYTLVVQDSSGCIESGSYTVPNLSAGYQPEICMVTVDTSTQNNLIIWTKTGAPSVKAYNIYCEIGSYNNFQLVGTVPGDSLSEFMHQGANSSVKSWKYEITAVDSCNEESALSTFHETIHLQTNLGVGNVVNLSWNNYSGFNYGMFGIWRYHPSTSWVMIDSIPYCGSQFCQNSYTDLNPFHDNLARYAILVQAPGNCTPTRALISTTRSNIKHLANVTGINTYGELFTNVKIYPNPAKENITIELTGLTEKTTIRIFNMLGQCVASSSVLPGSMNTLVKQIAVGGYASGVYTIAIEDSSRKTFRKIVIE